MCLIISPTNNRNKQRGSSKPANNNNNNKQQQRKQQQKQRSQPNTLQRSNQPHFSGTSNGIRVRHREYLSSISIANAGFEVWGSGASELTGNYKVIPINPGDGALSPWLSSIATNYEHYEFLSLRLIYSPSVSSFTSGAILMSPEFDPHNERNNPPTSLSDFLNKQSAVTGNVWSQFTLNIPKSKMAKKLVRPEHSLSVDTSHLRQTDVGQIYVALYNVETSQSIPYGELFVEYDVMLTTPNQSANTVKYYTHHVPLAEQAHIGVQHGALVGNDGVDQKKLLDPSFSGTGTVGVTHQHNWAAATMGGALCDYSRYEFSEPFTGQMTIAANEHAGAMASSAVPLLGHEQTLVYAPGYEPTSTPTTSQNHLVNTGGTGADLLGVWNIVAAAGDMLDIFWSDPGTWTFEDVMMSLAEVGELLPLLL